MGIRQNYSSPTLTFVHIKLRPKIFIKFSTPTLRNVFDTSDYPTYHPSGIKRGVNNKVFGIFKDEAVG